MRASKPETGCPASRSTAVTPLDVVAPLAAPSLAAEAVAMLAVADAADHGRAVIPHRQLDGRTERDRRRQHEAVVVVGVLADDVHAARRIGTEQLFRPPPRRWSDVSRAPHRNGVSGAAH